MEELRWLPASICAARASGVEKERQIMIFLSHSSKDKAFVRFLAGELQQCGYPSWLDENELTAGESLSARIEAALSSAEHVLVCVSQASIKSHWVNREIELVNQRAPGEQGGHRLIPCLLGQFGDADLPPAFLDVLYVDFRSPVIYDAQMARLLTALSGDRRRRLPAFDADRSTHLIAVACDDAVRGWLVEFLIDCLPRHPDESERYWIYVTVAELSTQARVSWFSAALQNEHGFARKGVLESLEILRDKPVAMETAYTGGLRL